MEWVAAIAACACVVAKENILGVNRSSDDEVEGIGDGNNSGNPNLIPECI